MQQENRLSSFPCPGLASAQFGLNKSGKCFNTHEKNFSKNFVHYNL
jgi:hypothetical protein